MLRRKRRPRFNRRKYSVFRIPNIDAARTEGFQIKQSEDGVWAIGDRGRGRDVGSSRTSQLPSYAPQSVIDFMAENGYLDHKHTLILVRTEASAEGSSDGWVYHRYNQ